MRKAVMTLGVLALLAGSVIGATNEMGMDLMQNIEDLNKSLANNIALHDAKASTSDAKELDGLFAQVEQHFTERGDAANAVDLSKKSRSLTRQIVQSVGAGDFTTATDAATDLSRTCRSCHTFYKKE
jgi:hypothetical protein